MSEYRVELVISGADEGASAVAESVAKSLTKIEDSAKRVSANATASLSSFMGGLGGALQVAAGNLLSAGIGKVGDLARGVIDAGFSFDDLKQRATIAFETMLGSGEKARGMVERLRDFAASTPFEFPDLITGAQRLLAMNFRAQEIIPTLTAVGDAAAGLGGSPALIDQITRALGQMRAKGKVMAGEMLQLTEAGVPAWQMLADKIGVSVPEAMKMAEKGVISANTAIGALVEGMNAKFGGLMAKQAGTWSGVVSTLKDNLTQAAGVIVEPFFNMATKGVAAFNGVLSSGEIQKGIAQFSQNVASGLERGISFVVDTAIPAVRTLVDSFANSNFVDALTTQFTAVSNVITGTFIPALVMAVTWVQANLLPPFLQFAQWMTNVILPAIVNVAGGFAQWFIPVLVRVGEIVGSVLAPVLLTLIGILQNQVGPALEKIGGVLNNTVFPALKAFADWIGPKIAPLLTTLLQLIGVAIIDAVQRFANSLTQAGGAAQSFANAMGRAFKWVLDRIADTVQKMGELLNLLGGGQGNDLIKFAGSMRTAFNELAISVQTAVSAGNAYARVMKDDVVTATDGATRSILSEGDALKKQNAEAYKAAHAAKAAGDEFAGMGEDALTGANKTSQAADIMRQVADKIRGMVENLLQPTTVQQRLEMVGDAWDEFRLRLEAVTSGTPLDAYGQKFVDQVRMMQQITGLALPDIAAKFKDFSLFANMDWLKGALESGAVDLEPIKARINEQIQQIIGQANLMKAAFNEVWASLSQQTKLDLANALGLSPQAANNATQVFQALSGTQAQTATTTVNATATATSALNTALNGTQTLANNVTTALGNVPAKMQAVQNAETPFRETTLKLNETLGSSNVQLKTMYDYLEKARGSMDKTPAVVTTMTGAFTEASAPIQAFNTNTLTPIANTLGAILSYMQGIIAAAPSFSDALSDVDVDEAIKPGSPSPLETTLGHIFDHMGNMISISPRLTDALRDFGITTVEQLETAWKKFQETFGQYRNMTLPEAIRLAESLLPQYEQMQSATQTNGTSSSAVNTVPQAEKRVVFSGPIHVHNPANFEAFMDEINRRVDTIVVNGD